MLSYWRGGGEQTDTFSIGSKLKKEVNITQGHDWAPFLVFNNPQVLHGTLVLQLGILTPQDSFGSDDQSPF